MRDTCREVGNKITMSGVVVPTDPIPRLMGIACRARSSGST
jgi:hypothetical protein